MKIIRESARIDASKYGQYGYGGSNRTMQVDEYLRGFCKISSFVDVEFGTRTTIRQRLKAVCRLLVKHKFKVKMNKWLLGWSAQRYLDYLTFFSKHADSKIFLLEEPPSFIAYHAAKDSGLKIVVIVHNLETMVAEYTHDFFTKVPFPFSMIREIEYLKQADEVICISREEQWLLNSFGINAMLLPYLPPKDKFAYFLKIREKRALVYVPSNSFLIVGTTHNFPTINSLRKQLETLSQLRESEDFDVTLVGYGTESLREEFENKYRFLRVEGTVSPERLETLLASKEAVLIQQDEGVGALTKIPEYLIAGVPIIASHHAARSAYHLEGVRVYNSGSELKAHLLEKDKAIPPIPSINPLHAEFIAQKIKSLL